MRPAPLVLAALALAATACVGARSAPEPAFDPAVERAAVSRVLDGFHAAAASADEERYMDSFAPEAVFLGTAAEERWTRAEFGVYVHEHFSAGRGWEYHPRDRHVALSPDGGIAWFDEALDNAGYGELRGTGALAKLDGDWKIAHYNLTFTVPNEVAGEVVATIRRWKETRR